MSRVASVVARLRKRMDEFDAAEQDADLEGQLAALDGALDYLYKLREYRRNDHPGGPNGYDADVRASPAGQVTEAIVMLRGKLTHFLATDIEPRHAHLYPSNNLFPSETTIIGEVLRWPLAARVLQEHHEALDHPAWFNYEASVAQKPVRLTLEICRRFLLDSPIIGQPPE